MEKEKITRELLKRNIMKGASFNINYTTALNIENFIDKKRQFFHNYFNFYKEGEEKEIKIEIGNINKVLENNVIGTVHLFKGFKNKDISVEEKGINVEENVQLNITRNNINLEINPGNNYKKIDNYLNFIVLLLKEIELEDTFSRINTITIKKNSYDIYNNLEELFKNFEKNIISDTNDLFKRKLIREIETIEYKSFLIYYNRGIENGIIQENGQTREAFRGYLDISGILEEEQINNCSKIEDLKKMLFDLNEALFDVFKFSMTEEFLNKNLGEQNV